MSVMDVEAIVFFHTLITQFSSDNETLFSSSCKDKFLRRSLERSKTHQIGFLEHSSPESPEKVLLDGMALM